MYVRDPVRAHVIVLGQVQGVGYRAWTRRTAQERGIFGWVRNMPDGSVEAILEGDRDVVGAMVEAMKRGPNLAEVTTVNCTLQINYENLKDFEIKR